ncbi:hypothetical protein KC19_VG140300 [Ceratodon purpureus]|uniref:Secreted protein n=1 Tax=Ceratodon purpureus TaxID=3225 RepID=A0A8T0HQE3_CERPU|nr:hypothetical protein KC19_VG140300 [Ceratodon purpureus]
MGFYYKLFVLMLCIQAHTWHTTLSESGVTFNTCTLTVTISHHFSNPSSAISLRSSFTFLLLLELSRSKSIRVIPILYLSVLALEDAPIVRLSVLPCPSITLLPLASSIVPLTSKS